MTAATAADAVTCPMGEAVEGTAEGKGPGCFCRIAKEVLGRDTDSRSLVAFCSGDHTRCPTWRTWKDAVEADQHRHLERQVARSVPRDIR